MPLTTFSAGSGSTACARPTAFLAISHLLIAASVRVARIDCKSELLGQFRDYMEKNFPDFRENRYLPRLDRNKRLVYRLLLKRRYRVVRLLFRIKDGR